MKETGIIMSGNHPKLILGGIKTQTRRVIKLKNYHRNVWDYCVPHNGQQSELLGEPYLKVPHDEITDNAGTRITCPYGQVGDSLWVKETLDIGLTILGYRAGGQVNKMLVAQNADWFLKWKLTYVSSLFMPRWASRITLEITEVRVERVQEISIDDAFKEGTPMPYERGDGAWNDPYVLPRFQELWDSLNAKRGYGWDTNPWVWVINFKRVGK